MTGQVPKVCGDVRRCDKGTAYRLPLVSTMCGLSDETKSWEMASIIIDVHVQVAHPFGPRGGEEWWWKLVC